MLDVEHGDMVNELGWWSSWASPLPPLAGAPGFYSKEFREALFNRVTFTEPPKRPQESVRKALDWFGRRRISPAFFVKEEPNLEPLKAELGAAGYRQSDRFVIMEQVNMSSGFEHPAKTKVISPGDADLWSRTYLDAFYGEESLFSLVRRKVRLSVARRSNRLLLATVEGKAAGTMALHTERGYTGLYCLGTVPSMRGRGVAGSLLQAASSHVKKHKTKLILQLFESDGVERFYLERGFRRAFAEEVLVHG